MIAAMAVSLDRRQQELLASLRRALPIVLLGSVIFACIQAPVRVDTVLTPGASFERGAAFALTAPPWPHAELGERIEAEIREQLDAKGLREVPLYEAELAVSYRATREDGTRTRFVPDPDSMGYQVREDYIEKTVEVDVFDASTRSLLWRGIGQIDVASEASLPAAVTKSIRAVLGEFPLEP